MGWLVKRIDQNSYAKPPDALGHLDFGLRHNDEGFAPYPSVGEDQGNWDTLRVRFRHKRPRKRRKESPTAQSYMISAIAKSAIIPQFCLAGSLLSDERKLV